jgi:hypothetical protein
VIKNQHEKDTAICDLYETMMATLKAASEKDILKQQDELQEHFEKMAKLSIECSLFITGYSSGRYYSTLVSGDVLMFHRSTDIKAEIRTADEILHPKQNFPIQGVIPGVGDRANFMYGKNNNNYCTGNSQRS